MPSSPSCLDAAASDFLPPPKAPLPRPRILSPRQHGFGCLTQGFDPPPFTVTALGEVGYPSVAYGRSVSVAEDVLVDTRAVRGAQIVTLNYDAMIEPILARAAELQKDGAAHSPSLLSHEVAHATKELDASAVAKLIRVVKTWNGRASTVESDTVTTVVLNNNSARHVAVQGAVGSGKSIAFPTFVLDGQHRRLAASFAWYRRWSTRALATAFFGFKPCDLLRQLRKRQSELRPAVIGAPAAPARKLVGQIERLAHAIVPNAPPARTWPPSSCTC
jgi:hypothetical protein